MPNWLRMIFCATALSLVLAGCARDSSAELWSRLNRWFELSYGHIRGSG